MRGRLAHRQWFQLSLAALFRERRGLVFALSRDTGAVPNGERNVPSAAQDGKRSTTHLLDFAVGKAAENRASA